MSKKLGVCSDLAVDLEIPAASVNAKIIVIQTVPLMRLAISAVMSGISQLGTLAIESFASVAEASEVLARLGAGDVIIADVPAWSALDKDKASNYLPSFRAKGAALALVTNADDNGARLLRGRGVSGIIAPDAEPQAFVEMLKELLSGRTSFQKTAHTQDFASGLDKLSHRQFEILELMTRGLLNKQIAWELGLTEGTVKSHVSAILEKLGCDRRTQAITTFMHSVGVGRISALSVTSA